MRGTPFAPPTPVDTTGIIPAYAGNTQQASGLVERRRGSSPRMRGTRPRSAIRTRTCGIIPAYAGNTANFFSVRGFPWDHPRVCGEHAQEPPIDWHDKGSSPRMRGTLDGGVAVSGDDGIIPAYAGNTIFRLPADCLAWDHPRVCGEHVESVLWHHVRLGSSPRMRGTPSGALATGSCIGIIPAYAGNTVRCARHR